ncbi:putative F-box domain-containing protein [Medicago truncatula]|uniref:F-box protein n=1 Tax=Medicago truncatula TaxID=3880 RepID=G7KK34_MEDTR|nr:F-box protein [Medicago truncatula]RHN65005.1 putative F-box domain-containing protein [Medicago truncatula]
MRLRQLSFDAPSLLTLLSLDLLLEILYRLPVKSLMILKCVCKPLNALISDPIFAKDHIRFSHIRITTSSCVHGFHFKTGVGFLFEEGVFSL